MNNVETIKPFKNFCMTIGALPTSYLESMSYYETLCWLCKYLENTINPAINNNAEALKELQSYVANYFNNLNVQEEINNKLDDMAESGELAQIINVEMIGTLENLTTNDKTDLVSAINEVNPKLTNISNVTSSIIEGDTEYIDSVYTGNYAWSDNSIWFKFFVDMTLKSTSGISKTLKFNLPNGFTVTESYRITNAGLITEQVGGGLFGMAYIDITPTGIVFSYSSTSALRLTLLPFLYYNGNIES